MKKVIGIMLVCVLTLLVAGCGGGKEKEESSTAPEATKGAVTAKPADETSKPTDKTDKPAEVKTLTMLVEAQNAWTYNKDKYFWRELEKRTNIRVVGTVPPGDDYPTALNLTIASNQMPDLMFMDATWMANNYGLQGALVNILDYEDQMPAFKNFITAHPDVKKRFLTPEGKMYMFPNLGVGEANRITWMYREDIFKKNNLKIPQTYDELYDVAKKLKKLYPDSYPISSLQGMYMVNFMAPQFNTFNDLYYDPDAKEWRYGPIEDNYKKLVIMVNKFYKEGLIPPDWLTMDNKRVDDLISNNKTFIHLSYMVMDQYNIPLRKDNPEFSLLFMPPPAGFEGAKRQNINQNYENAGLTVSSTSKNIETAMKLMDYYYTDEGEDLSTWGIEGITYEIKDGKKKFLDTYTKPTELREKPGLLNYGTYTRIDWNAFLSFSPKETQDAFAQAAKYDSYLQPTVPLNAKELDVANPIITDLQKYKDESIIKFMLGDKNINEWDKYVEEMKKLGVDKLLTIYKGAYERLQ